MSTKDFPIDHVMERVKDRIKASPHSQLDIYIWADGRVTGPPTGEEPDEAHLVTLVTPTGGIMPTPEEIRATILKGVRTAPDEPEQATLPAAGLEEVPPPEAHDRNGDPGR